MPTKGRKLLNMCNCSNQCGCSCVTDLGCVDPCGALDTEIGAAYTGEYTLRVGYLGATINIVEAQTASENITFQVSGLSEDFTFDGQIIDRYGDVEANVRFTTSAIFNL